MFDTHSSPPNLVTSCTLDAGRLNTSRFRNEEMSIPEMQLKIYQE